MAPFPSITTTLYALVFLSLLMEFSPPLSLIPVTRTTKKDSRSHILLLPGGGVLEMPSMSSFRKSACFPSSFPIHIQYAYTEHASFRDPGIQKVLSA